MRSLLPSRTTTRRTHPAPQGHSGLVLQAPPGAGKTTTLPLAMLLSDPEWMRGGGAGGSAASKIILLEPRRLAARAAAARMAWLGSIPFGGKGGGGVVMGVAAQAKWG